MVSHRASAASPQVWVKICGTTNVSDALACVQAGADALGFIFVPASPRVVTRKKAEEILASLPATVLAVAVVADESPDFMRGLLRVLPFQAVQFHGEETPDEVLSFKGQVKLIKAIRVTDEKSLEKIPRYRGVDAVLLDTYQSEKLGGTGQQFDWALAEKAKEFGVPIVVAGGLTVENVADLVKQIRPFGVDAASGLEKSPGQKDHDRVREFIVRIGSAAV